MLCCHVCAQTYIPASFGVLCAIFIAAGVFLGGGLPIFYELLVETTYPLHEDMGGLVITVRNNFGGIVLLGVTAAIPSDESYYVTLIMAASAAFASVGIACSRVRYLRSDRDDDSAGTDNRVPKSEP